MTSPLTCFPFPLIEKFKLAYSDSGNNPRRPIHLNPQIPTDKTRFRLVSMFLVCMMDDLEILYERKH